MVRCQWSGGVALYPVHGVVNVLLVCVVVSEISVLRVCFCS
jgi:hypothetical protein